MKKFIAKLGVLTLAISMCIAFSACSSKNVQNIDENSDNTESTSVSESTSNDTTTAESTTGTESSTTTTTKVTTKPKTTIAKGTSLSKNQALDLLGEHYGDEYEVNGSTQDKNNYNVKVIKKGESSPTYKVIVNLSNGNVKQTELASGKTTSFSLN